LREGLISSWITGGRKARPYKKWQKGGSLENSQSSSSKADRPVPPQDAKKPIRVGIRSSSPGIIPAYAADQDRLKNRLAELESSHRNTRLYLPVITKGRENAFLAKS
jgi:hypothetical protein